MRRSATRNFLHSGNFASRVVINVVEHISSLPAVMAGEKPDQLVFTCGNS